MSGKRSHDAAFNEESVLLELESEKLEARLAQIHERQSQILCDQGGQPWSADALDRSFEASQKQTPVKGSAADAAVRTRCKSPL